MRIPKSLQTVFISSWTDNEVKEAPSDNVACKTFVTKKGLLHGNNKKKSKLKWPFRAGGKKANKFSANSTQDALDCTSVSTASTMISDSSIRSNIPNNIQIDAPVRIEVITQKKSDVKNNASSISPQDYLNNLLKSRGYSTDIHKTLQSGYDKKPTPLQLASYHPYLTNLAVGSDENIDTDLLRSIITCGISPQPCNKFGESMLHKVCRRSNSSETLQILLSAGAKLCIADDYGKTPLHDACWRAEPNFELVEMIITAPNSSTSTTTNNLHLFYMADIRGSLPLSYVHADHWDLWIDFLESKKDSWWPERFNEIIASSTGGATASNITDPANALKLDLASLVVAGRLEPKEAILLNAEDLQKTVTNDGKTTITSSNLNANKNGEDVDEEFSDSESDYSDSEDDFSECDDDDDCYSDDDDDEDSLSSYADDDIFAEMVARAAACENLKN